MTLQNAPSSFLSIPVFMTFSKENAIGLPYLFSQPLFLERISHYLDEYGWEKKNP